jgi:ADP-ribose pyrophosphatase YjhB (NUDIX family)
MLVVALALVEKDDQILLIQEAQAACRGKWFLPGGRMDPGESVIDCVKREVLEEAGLAVEPVGLLYLDQSIASAGAGVDRLRFVFKARAVGGAPKIVEDSHSLGAQWFRREDIAGLPLRSPIVTTIISVAERSEGLLPMSSVQALISMRQ